MVLILVTGGVCFSGCDKDNEEDLPGASRPDYNMLSDLSKGESSLYLTEWEWYTYQENTAGNKTTIKYTYNFTYPTVVLTPEKEDESVITGTIVSGRITQADEATFVNAQEKPVWKKLTRKK